MKNRFVDPAQDQYMQEGRQPPQQVTASQAGQIGGAFATPLEEEVKKRRKENEAGEKEIDTRIKADEESYQAEREKYFEEELKPEEIRAAEEEERERKSLIDEINKRIEEKRRKTYGIRELETYTQDEKDKIAKALVRSGLSPFTVKELMSEIRNEQSLYAILSLYEYNPQEIKVIADSVIPPEKR